MNLRSAVVLAIAFTIGAPVAVGQKPAATKVVQIADDARLHYVDRGEGEPVVFVHGLLDDYSSWLPQVEAFAGEGYRAISYSRRHNYPNENEIRSNHSASLEADDLAALIRQLELERAHVVGFSYGAYTALLLALHHADVVRSVTLVEAPIAPWLADLPGEQAGAARTQWTNLLRNGVAPARAALDAGDERAAIRAMFDCIAGEGRFESLPPFVQAKCLRNVAELQAFLLSEDRYPAVDRELVGRLEVPTLILSGGDTAATARFTDPELERLIPEQSRRRIVFENATHILWIEQPVRFRNVVLEFLRGK